MKYRKAFLSLLTFAFFLVGEGLFSHVQAHDPHEHPALAGWAEDQQVMPDARTRFGCVSELSYCACCIGSEIVKTKFRPIKGNKYDDDGWEWFNPRSKKWEQVEDDIIHWGEPTPDKQAVAFEYPIGSGKLRCFFPPQQEGG